MTDRNLADLDPRLLPKAQAFLKAANLAVSPSTVSIIVTWRDSAAQNEAHAAGLSKAGAGQSPHNVTDENGKPASLAFDFAVFDGGAYVTNGADSRYTICGGIAEGLGLIWGGSWTKAKDGCSPDTDHAEMMRWRSLIGGVGA